MLGVKSLDYNQLRNVLAVMERGDNIILNHSTPIELVKLINSEADTLTYKDIQ